MMEKKESMISVRLPKSLRENFGKWCLYNRVGEADAVRELIRNLTAVEGGKKDDVIKT